MTAEIGHFALILSLVTALAGALLPLAGAALGIRAWMRTARAAAAATAFSATIALTALAVGFLSSDFSMLNVVRHSNALLPWYYKLAAVWGSHEGSILFWGTTLSWWTLIVALAAGRTIPERALARIVGTLSLIAFGLFLFVLTTSNPFLRYFPPALDGADLNPLLQDPGMIFHPPLLYLGYVGFAVPFAFAVAALLEGRLDTAWARWMRPWTTASWVLLTLGMALGSFWSYYELGWGGWWAWDPVENSSLMPWLTGTALMHSLAVTQKRGAFRASSVFLAILTFSLSLLGTFLVRSGVITSVHAFASDPKRGLFILVFLTLVICVSFLLFAWRGSRIGSSAGFEAGSRESIILSGNLILVVACASVLLGTLYPLALEALGGGKISVGSPYFNAVFGAVMAPLAFLLAAGTGMPWWERKVRERAKTLLPACLVALAGTAGYLWAMGGWKTAAAIGAFLTIWIAAGSVTDLVAGARKGFLKSPAWWGMTAAHLGVACVILGAVSVSNYETERSVSMRPGETVTIRDAVFRYNGWAEYRGPNYTAARGSITILAKDGSVIAETSPEKRNYDSMNGMTMTEASIAHRIHEDLYVSLATPTPDGMGWVVRAYVKPFVMFLWLGALLMSAGGLVSLFDARKCKVKGGAQ